MSSLLVASCGGNSPASMVESITMGDPAAPYLGMSTQQIIACAGTPHSRYATGAGSETLTYRYSGAGPVPSGAAAPEKKSMFGGGGKTKNKGWTCTASLAFENGRLQRVHYAHKDVRSPYDWQSQKDPKKQEEMRNAPMPTCAFSLPNCRRS